MSPECVCMCLVFFFFPFLFPPFLVVGLASTAGNSLSVGGKGGGCMRGYHVPECA
ncbi:hypothetical protein LY78DRAFT_661230 [Colletotrichum sublineola]|nr:hypothetical protein LY78DRAFT_661230 [Colletotrichum sublineola]